MLQTLLVCLSFYLNDSSAQAAHMPKLLHWDLAYWSLQEQRKSCRQLGSWQAVLPALETPQTLWQAHTTTQLL